MDIFVNQLIQFYVNTSINPRLLTPHIMPSYTHNMAIVSWRYILWRHFTRRLPIGYINQSINQSIHLYFRQWAHRTVKNVLIIIQRQKVCSYTVRWLYIIQEAQLSPRDRAMRRVNWNLANCPATVQKLLIRQVLTKSMAWSWRFSRRQCVIDNVHSAMTRSSRLPLSGLS